MEVGEFHREDLLPLDALKSKRTLKRVAGKATVFASHAGTAVRRLVKALKGRASLGEEQPRYSLMRL